MKKILVYHPTGNQNVRHLLIGLSSKHILQSFHTTIAVFRSSFYYPLLSVRLFQRIARRTFPNEIKNKTIRYPILECLLFMGKKTYKGKQLSASLVNKIIAKDVAAYINKHSKKIDSVYSFPYGSLQLFEAAKNNGIKCVYELTTGYYKTVISIAEKEKTINPHLASTIKLYNEPKTELAKLDKELTLADYVLCASSYIKTSLALNGYDENKIKVIPYGFPLVNEKKVYFDGKHELKVLYAGNITQLKGISYIRDAVSYFKGKVVLTLAGTISDKSNSTLMSFIQDHKYEGSLDHDKLLNLMHENDLFIFPTLSDGYGMVVSEAMSQGTPVITTPNSCGPDIIRSGENGWIVPVQDSLSIRMIIQSILDNPNTLKQVSLNALKTAAMRPWSMYSSDVANFLESIS